MKEAAQRSASGQALARNLRLRTAITGPRPQLRSTTWCSRQRAALPALRRQVCRSSKGPETVSELSVMDREEDGPAPGSSGSSGSSVDDLAIPGLEPAAATTSGNQTGLIASVGFIGGILLVLGGGYVFKDQISAFLDFFIAAVDEWGPLGYLAYAAVYAGLEVLAVPAIPLTMTAGVIFGIVPGTILVSVAGTVAATIAFLIARYAARDKVLKFASKNPKFAAIDRAIGKDGFKFVTLLRLSPLLPLAVSNYLYGLTSVNLAPYVLGSWLGMLPGTYAFVSAGSVSKVVLTEGHGALGLEPWQIALGLGVTLVAIGFVGQLAKKAIEEADENDPKDEKV